MGTKVGGIDIQFGPDWEPAKANQLVQQLQQVTRAVNTVVNAQQASTTPLTPTSYLLATQEALGSSFTVEDLQAGQVLVALSATTAHFGALEFAQLAGTDPGTFANPTEGSVIVFVDGYWSAAPNSLGLADPGTDALIMWDTTQSAGAGGLTWATAGEGIKLSSGALAVATDELVHGQLLALLADDHPQYALVTETPGLDLPNTFTEPNSFLAGVTSGSDLNLAGNLEQTGLEGVEWRIQNTDDQPDEGIWRVHIEPGQAMHASVADPDPNYPIGSDGENWLYIQRIAELVDTVGIQANSFTFNGFDVCCGTVTAGGGAMPATLTGYLTITVAGQTIKVPYVPG